MFDVGDKCHTEDSDVIIHTTLYRIYPSESISTGTSSSTTVRYTKHTLVCITVPAGV